VHGNRGGCINNDLCGFEDTLDREHSLFDTPLEGCREVFVHEGTFSFVCDNVIPNSLEQYHVSTMCSQPSLSSPELDYDVPIDNFEICDSKIDMGSADNMLNMLRGNVENFESLGSLCGYDVVLDQYCIDLEDKPRKIMWNTIFDFSMAFSFIKRALIYFALILCMLSYCQAWRPFVEEFDKLLRALSMSVSDLNSRGLSDLNSRV